MNKRIILIFVAALVMIAFAACSSDEPDGGEKEDNPTPTDTATVSEDTIPKGDTVVPVDTFIPPAGPFEPLTEDIRPILTDGKKWIIKRQIIDCKEDKDTVETIICVVEGDTIVPAGKGKILGCYYSDGKQVYRIVLKEENGNIYIEEGIKKEEFTKSVIMYPTEEDVAADFSWRSSGTMPFQGKLRRTTKIIGGGCQYDYDPYWYDYLVEGVGSLKLSRVATTGIGVVGIIHNYMYIEKCYDGDELIYDRSELNDIIYTPTVTYRPDL